MKLLLQTGFAICAAHATFWGAFVIARLVARASAPEQYDNRQSVARAPTQDSVPHSRALVSVHAFAFAILYFGVGGAVFGGLSVALCCVAGRCCTFAPGGFVPRLLSDMSWQQAGRFASCAIRYTWG